MSVPIQNKTELVLATANAHKIREIRSRLSGLRLLSLKDFPEIPEIEETGQTFYENALIKARTVSKILNKPVLADDSGLSVYALNGEPGVRSARYAGENSSQKQLIGKLLRNMKGKTDRRAWFTTVMVLYGPCGLLIRATGKVYGLILSEPRGEGGFGYDPLFYYPPFDCTFAESSLKDKNRVSHRSKALEKIGKKIGLHFKDRRS